MILYVLKECYTSIDNTGAYSISVTIIGEQLSID